MTIFSRKYLIYFTYIIPTFPPKITQKWAGAQTWKKTINSRMLKFERKEIPEKVRDIKLNKYFKKFTILIIANGFGCISRSIAVNSSVLG